MQLLPERRRGGGEAGAPRDSRRSADVVPAEQPDLRRGTMGHGRQPRREVRSDAQEVLSRDLQQRELAEDEQAPQIQGKSVTVTNMFANS